MREREGLMILLYDNMLIWYDIYVLKFLGNIVISKEY